MTTQPTTSSSFDHQVDWLIVGSGTGSVVAALVGKDAGLNVLIIEKEPHFGGTSAYSGGVAWIPNNPLMARAGIKDTYERAREYLDAAIWYEGPATSASRREAFLRSGPDAVAYLETKGMKFCRPEWWPDYHSDLPGGEQTSRSIQAEPFDLNELGEWKQRFAISKTAPLRFRMSELSQLILMKRTWTARMFAVRFAGRLLSYKLRGQDMRGAGSAWQGRLLQIALREKIPIWLETPAVELLTESGRVVGVKARREGRTISIEARYGVLLNAGGFARNPAMRQRYGRQPVYAQCTNAAPGDTGEMIEAAQELGAATDCMDEALWGVSSLAPGGRFPQGALASDGTPLPFGHHFDISLPHVILVDQNGERFANEAASYMEVCQGLYRRHDETGKGIPAWAIIESRHRSRYLWGNVLGTTPQSWFDTGYMKRATSLQALANQCGIDANGLQRTVARFNQFCRSGIDEDFGRGAKAFDNCHGDPTVRPNPNVGAIEKPPFYAVAIVPGDVSTWGGVVCDEHARVLTKDGRVIDGLYATGTTTASVCGRTYAGAGASLGP
ncbi:MAG: FAD-binding protein, partial [Steroidobacteraceae bacterium]